LSFLLALLLFTAGVLFGQPMPTADPVVGNVWYGAVPPNGSTARVLVFIHGLGGTASFFWTNNNDMYSTAYNAGYRTAFISMNADNTPNSNTIAQNGNMIKQTLPTVLQHYQVNRVVMVCHSKGGLDAQYAIGTNAGTRSRVRAMFTLSTPNQGSAMADWASGPGKQLAQQLGLLSPGMASLQTTYVQAYRAQWDPIFAAAGIPFYYVGGTVYTGNRLTAVTGPILQGLTGEANDGLVAPSETTLPLPWGTNMGTVPNNHFLIGTGSVSFPVILPYLLTL
jgi:pimeloyl-ACP methyl ester carboxylesterase